MERQAITMEVCKGEKIASKLVTVGAAVMLWIVDMLAKSCSTYVKVVWQSILFFTAFWGAALAIGFTSRKCRGTCKIIVWIMVLLTLYTTWTLHHYRSLRTDGVDNYLQFQFKESSHFRRVAEQVMPSLETFTDAENLEYTQLEMRDSSGAICGFTYLKVTFAPEEFHENAENLNKQYVFYQNETDDFYCRTEVPFQINKVTYNVIDLAHYDPELTNGTFFGLVGVENEECCIHYFFFAVEFYESASPKEAAEYMLTVWVPDKFK